MTYQKQTWVTGAAGGTPLSAARLGHLEEGVAAAHRLAGGIDLDSFAGDDDAKLDAAIARQQSTYGMPPIVLGERVHRFNRTRTLYSGLKLVGARPSGPKNLELSGSTFVPSQIVLGPLVGSGPSSWWVTPGSDVYDVFMADFAVAGDAGSSVHQFLDFPVSSGHTLFACEFRSLSFNFMRAVFGLRSRPCAVTQVTFSGHWTALNLWDTQFTLGGSDCNLWMGGQINIGNSQSPKQTGRSDGSDYQMVFSSVGKTNVGYIYLTAYNGWRGLKITGNSGAGLTFYGGTFEGTSASGTRLLGPAPGTLISIEGGAGAFYGPVVGQGMDNPTAAEGGLVHMTGGEWSVFGATFIRGSMAETRPCVHHAGGRLLVSGVVRPPNEVWTSRPRYRTSSARNATQNSFYCPDMSMVSV